MKRSLCIILMGLLVISFAFTGCKGTDEGTTTTTKVAQQTTRSTEPITLSMFVNHTWFWMDTYGGRPVDEELTKRTGVTLDITKAADSEQMSIVVASGELPDMFYTMRNASILQNPEICYNYPELIEKYAPDFPITDFEKANNTAPDGNIYTVKNAYYTPEEWADPKVLPSGGLGSITVRQDILDELGLTINSMQDFENALVAVHEKYPNMLPIMFIIGDKDFQTNFALAGLPTGPTFLYAEDGKVFYQTNHPAYKETLALLNKWYRMDLISAEMLTYKFDQQKLAFGKGEVFAQFAFAANEEIDNAFYKVNNIEGTWKALALKTLSDKVVNVDDGVGWAGVFISKKCKDPERAIQYLEYVKSDEGSRLVDWGIEDVHYTIAADGYPEFTMYEGVDKVVEFGIGCWIFGVSGKYEGIYGYGAFGLATRNTLLEWKSLTEFKPWFQFVIPEAGTDESTVYVRLAQIAKDAEISLIVQETEADFDSAFDDFTAKLEAAGMKDLEKWMTDKYTDVIKRYEK